MSREMSNWNIPVLTNTFKNFACVFFFFLGWLCLLIAPNMTVFHPHHSMRCGTETTKMLKFGASSCWHAQTNCMAEPDRYKIFYPECIMRESVGAWRHRHRQWGCVFIKCRKLSGKSIKKLFGVHAVLRGDTLAKVTHSICCITITQD